MARRDSYFMFVELCVWMVCLSNPFGVRGTEFRSQQIGEKEKRDDFSSCLFFLHADSTHFVFSLL